MDKIYVVMQGGEEPYRWDQHVRAFAHRNAAELFCQQLKTKHLLDKKYFDIANRAVLSSKELRRERDRLIWDNRVNETISKELSKCGLNENEIIEFLNNWQAFTPIIYWIEEVDYDPYRSY